VRTAAEQGWSTLSQRTVASRCRSSWIWRVANHRHQPSIPAKPGRP